MWQFLNRHRVLDQSKSSVRLYETAARYVLPAMVFLVGLRKNFDLCCAIYESERWANAFSVHIRIYRLPY